MWEDTENIYEDYTHKEAKEYCSNLILENHSDWKLPTIKELFTITDFMDTDSVLMTEFGYSYKYSNYWSSTKLTNDKTIEFYYLDEGKGKVRTSKETDKENVRCVRDIKNVYKTEKLVKKETKSKKNDLSYKNFNLGMNKSDIPSQIKLVKGSKMSEYDQSFKYSDSNNNIIKVDDLDFKVSFVIRGDNNKVKTLFFTAKSVNKGITENQLINLSKKLTDKPLKKRTMNNYKNGKLSTTILEYSEIKNGIKDDFRLIYTNDNGAFSKNEIMIMQSLINKKKSDASIKKIANEVSKDMFTKVKPNSFVCYSLSAYKQLFDRIDAKNYTPPSKCVHLKKSISFYSTKNKEYYNGRTIVEMLGKDSQSLWVWDTFIK